MHLRTILALSVALMLAEPKDDATKKDMERFQGKWTLISAQRDGTKTPEDEAKKITLAIQGNKFVLYKETEVISEGTFTLDPAKKPKQIDETATAGPNKGKTFLAIYEIDEEHHKICFAAPGKERPTAFSSEPGSGHLLQVWKRGKTVELTGTLRTGIVAIGGRNPSYTFTPLQVMSGLVHEYFLLRALCSATLQSRVATRCGGQFKRSARQLP